jgi:hypothetical protein
MPCDTRYTTTPLALERADRRVLAASLEGDGWTVTTQANGEVFARNQGMTLVVPAKGEARLTTSNYTADAERVRARILQSYGAQATRTALGRYGFKERAPARTLSDGTLVLKLGR